MALNKKTVDDINAKGKRVLVRCDFNVPLKDGKITDETRIVAALPTINKLINDGAKVILCSHLGKVKNGPNEGESLAPVAERLSEKLGKKVTFVADYNVTGQAATDAVAAMKDGDVVLLQNTRFRGKEETKPQEAGEAFAKELADLADIYVCDAFGSAHRAHASVAVVTKYISEKGGVNAVGYLMQKEIDFLGNAVENPVRPFVAILGGAKVADKLNVINNLIEKCDTLIIGGGMAFTFLKAKGYEIGKSLVDDEKIEYMLDLRNSGNDVCAPYADKFPGSTFYAGKKPWEAEAEIYMTCAIQNELNGEDAKKILARKPICVVEVSNMGCTAEAVEAFVEAKQLFAPGKAVNAGGVATSGLEMTQNSIRLHWSAEEVDEKLHYIMSSIHEQCVKYGTEADGYIDYVKGANIAGFMKVAKAMLAQGIV